MMKTHIINNALTKNKRTSKIRFPCLNETNSIQQKIIDNLATLKMLEYFITV